MYSSLVSPFQLSSRLENSVLFCSFVVNILCLLLFGNRGLNMSGLNLRYTLHSLFKDDLQFLTLLSLPVSAEIIGCIFMPDCPVLEFKPRAVFYFRQAIYCCVVSPSSIHAS